MPLSDAQIKKLLSKQLALPENRKCADCPTRAPRWASATIGCFICIKCSGIHRKLGTHLSFVRSVSLDTWKEKEAKVLLAWGNKKVNQYYEARLPKGYEKPGANGYEINSYDLEGFIRKKNEQKRWVMKKTSRKKFLKLCKSGELDSNESEDSDDESDSDDETQEEEETQEKDKEDGDEKEEEEEGRGGGGSVR